MYIKHLGYSFFYPRKKHRFTYVLSSDNSNKQTKTNNFLKNIHVLVLIAI